MDDHTHAMRECENTFVLHNQNHVDLHEEHLAHRKDNFLVDLAHLDNNYNSTYMKTSDHLDTETEK